MTFLTQDPSKPCRTVFRPFMTDFDRLFGADRPRNSRRIKHSSVFGPLAHRLKTVKTAAHQSGRGRESTKTHPALVRGACPFARRRAALELLLDPAIDVERGLHGVAARPPHPPHQDVVGIAHGIDADLR